jgi:hypothetical protein
MYVGSRRLAVWFGTGVALWGAPMIVLALVPHTPTALSMMALLGVGNALVDVGLFTLVARLVPERALGRVFGLLECIGGLAVGGGSMLAAWLAAGDLREALWVVGLIGPALVLIFWFPLRRLDDAMSARDEDLALLRRVDVFDPLPLPAIEELATGLRPTHVPAGGVLMEQGEEGPEGCFVIERGEAEVIGDGERIATVGPGQLVGEIALLRRVPRTATVRALSDMDLKYLDADRFLLVVTGWESSRDASSDRVDQMLGRFHPTDGRRGEAE